MKRFFLILLALSILSSSVAFSESLDLSVYTDEELEILRNRIDQELLARQGIEYWFDYGIGQYIPKIQLLSGKEPDISKFATNSDRGMMVAITNHEDGDFEEYVALLIAAGFVEDADRSTFSYEAKDGKGHSVRVSYYGKAGMNVSADPYRVDD